MGLFSQYIIQYLWTNLGNKHYSPRPCCCRVYLYMYRVMMMIYGDGTLEALHNPICSGFPDWEDYRAPVAMATNVSPHISPHRFCLLVIINTHRKQLETFLEAWPLVRFRMIWH